MSELENCPFCGGEAVLVHVPATRHYYPRCDDCGAEIDINFENDKDEAIAAWNQRNSSEATLLDGWVSVEDRLPDLGEQVLINIIYQQCYGGIHSEETIVVSGELENVDGDKVWSAGNRSIAWDYEFNLGFSFDDVTHWQAIQPPTTDKEAD